MTTNDLLILNFEEIRRRSIKLWSDIPETVYQWKPDEKAMTIIESIRHILEGEHWFHNIINNHVTVAFESPWKNLPYTNIEAEITFAKPYREQFLTTVRNFTVEDLTTIEIIRPEINQRRFLGDYLLRTAYHEAVHTGQLLDYLRTANVDRPKIWD